jgi:hypothetical protein
VSGEVTGLHLRAVLDARAPSTGEQLARHPARKVPGFDHTFRAPKSVSLLSALFDRGTSADVVAAHDASVNAAIGYLAVHLPRRRRRPTPHRCPRAPPHLGDARPARRCAHRGRLRTDRPRRPRRDHAGLRPRPRGRRRHRRRDPRHRDLLRPMNTDRHPTRPLQTRCHDPYWSQHGVTDAENVRGVDLHAGTFHAGRSGQRIDPVEGSYS